MRDNTLQIRRRDVVAGTDGQPQGPHPHIHILPCPYYTRPWRADSPYSRGEGGGDVAGRALVVARPVSCGDSVWGTGTQSDVLASTHRVVQ